MRTVVLVPNYSRNDALCAVEEISAYLTSRNLEVFVYPHNTRSQDFAFDIEQADLVISLGGDGTLLRAASLVQYSEVPILGISYGHLGWLTSTESSQQLSYVERALNKSLHVSRRATLSVDVEFEQKWLTNLFCLNEVALKHGNSGSIIHFDVAVCGHKIDSLRADGFIVSTATGSTGYALSAGGPIVTPEYNGKVCVPIAPHTILARAFLTASSDVVTLDLERDRPREANLFCDGEKVESNFGQPQHIEVRRGPGDILLLDNGMKNFYEGVSRVFYGYSPANRES